MTDTTSIPVNADGTYDEPTWGEGGGPFSVPPNEVTGLGGVALASNDVNYEWQHLARWIRATAITRAVPSDRGLFASFLFQDSGSWTTGGGTLNSSLAASWVLVDADGDGGVVVQFNVPVGSPHAFAASRDTYVSLNEDGTALYEAVGNGAAAPVIVAGYVQVWKVVTNGVQVTSATVLLPTVPTFRSIGVADQLTNTGGISTEGDLVVGGTLNVTGSTTLGSTIEVAGDAIFSLNVEIGGDLDMAGNNITSVGSVACASLTASTSAGVAVSGSSSNATAAAVSGTASSTGPGVLGTGTSNSGVQGVNSGAAASVAGTNSGTGPGVKGTGGSAAAGVEGVSTVAAQPGVKGTGAAGAASHGVTGVAVNTSSYGMSGSSAAAATTSGAGVRADALGDAPALWAVAVDGHAALLTTDVTSPKRAPLRITPCDADPTTTGVGDVLINSSRLNKIRHHDGTAYRSVHSSTLGHIFGAVMDSDQLALAGATGELCRVTITPESVGNVLLTASCFYIPSGDTDTLTVIIRDDTAGVNLITRVVRAKDVDASGARGEAVSIRYVYTLPTAAAGREFVIVLQTSAAGDINNPILSVEGLL